MVWGPPGTLFTSEAICISIFLSPFPPLPISFTVTYTLYLHMKETYLKLPLGIVELGEDETLLERLKAVLGVEVSIESSENEVTYCAQSAQSYLEMKEEVERLRVKCDKLASAVQSLTDAQPARSQYLLSQNRIFEAEVKDLQTQLTEAESFKYSILQAVKEMKGKLASLSTGIIEASTGDDAFDLPLP